MRINKIILTTLLILVCSSSFLFAQLDISKGLISDDQRFVRQAIDSALVIVRQDYVLKSTTGLDSTEWGRSGNPWFGRGYSLGVIAGDFVWVNSRINTPWAGDPNLKKYEKADTLKPLLSNAGIRHLYCPKYIEAERNHVDSLLSSYKFRHSAKGLNFGNTHGDQQGWIVLAYSQKPLADNDTSKIELSIYKASVIFNDSIGEALLNKIPDKENIIGGIFITTQITTGNVQLLISGILTRKLLNWYIYALVPTQKTALDDDIQLTPIPANNSRKTD
jgi:hypothetical protein